MINEALDHQEKLLLFLEKAIKNKDVSLVDGTLQRIENPVENVDAGLFFDAICSGDIKIVKTFVKHGISFDGPPLTLDEVNEFDTTQEIKNYLVSKFVNVQK
jgi:hypothetical protein